MIKRYRREKMANVFSEDTKFKNWWLTEAATIEGKEHLKMLPPGMILRIPSKFPSTVARVEEIEAEVEHDMNAFIMAVQEKLEEDIARELHKGLTSYDVEEPALALQLKAAIRIILEDIKYILEFLGGKANTHRWTVMAFKSHGQIAELGTLGIKFLRWYDLLERCYDNLERIQKEIGICKLSGAVGTYSTLPPAVEKEVANILGLRPARIASQIVSRDHHARMMSELAILASVIEQVSLEIRLHAQTEIGELQEPFKKGKQKGSSAMPHKRNPVICERLCGLARVIRADLTVAIENIATWDERDISHSGPERVIFADSFILADYMLAKLAYVLGDLKVFPERMKENIDRMHGTLFSQQIKIFLLNKGVNPEVAYRLVQECAFNAMEKQRHISDIIAESPVFWDLEIDIQELKNSCFDPKSQLEHVDEIFARFGL